MPLGTEVDLGPGDIVSDEDPAPPMYCGQTAARINMPPRFARVVIPETQLYFWFMAK